MVCAFVRVDWAAHVHSCRLLAPSLFLALKTTRHTLSGLLSLHQTVAGRVAATTSGWCAHTILSPLTLSLSLSPSLSARDTWAQVRYKRGYQNVIQKGIELNEAGIDTPLMIETSGHGAMRDNFFLDDGAYLAVQVVKALVRAPSSYSDGFDAWGMSSRRRFATPAQSLEHGCCSYRGLHVHRESVGVVPTLSRTILLSPRAKP